MHVPTRLGVLLLLAEALVVAATMRSVDQDVRIRETIARGEVLVAAVRAFERDHARLPATLAELIPRYVPLPLEPEYGVGDWEYLSDVKLRRPVGDDVAHLELPLPALQPARSATTARTFELSVRLDRADSTA